MSSSGPIETTTASRGGVAFGTPSRPTTIVLLAGPVKVPDRIGHHDYLAGCRLLAGLLEQTPGVRTTVVRDGWPTDERVFDSAQALVVYAGGGHKLPLLQSPERIACLQRLIDQQVGLVTIHQAVSHPAELAERGMSWSGGVHVRERSGRGHWPSDHREFPLHPVTRGVEPWKITDGWLNEIEFVAGMHGVTPVIWSGPEHHGSPAGGAADVVSWAYERPSGGRSFCFTGLDGHSTWSAAGVRRLLVNGTLWAAGMTIPDDGAPCTIDEAAVESYLTPRGSRAAWIGKLLRRGGRRLARYATAPAAGRGSARGRDR